ncbi:MAG TPA: ABC transporter permease [Bacteroidales bacterium]|nr:ABC transporter permease [Bacteroidales bacterium]
MKRFIGFIIKEFYHIFRDYRTLIILFGIPVAQILIFGYVVTNEIKNVKIAVLDESKDVVTMSIVDKMLSSGYFILDKELSSVKQIEPVFRGGEVKEVIIFEPDFAKNLEKTGKAGIRIVADASDANTGNLIANYTRGIIMNYVASMNQNLNIPYEIRALPRMYFNQGLKAVYMFVPGTMALIIILISALMTSITITREKEMGTMETLLVSPLRPVHIIIGKVTPYVFLSFVDALIIILLGYFIFGVPVTGSLLLLMVATVIYVSLALSLGIFISTVATSQQMAMFISMLALMLPTILLSGFIFPIENMPVLLQWLSAIMPARWFVALLKDIMIRGNGILFIWKELLILVGMTILFIILSIKRFKIRLE